MGSLKPNFLMGLFYCLSFISATPVAAEDKMKIVASFSILADMVQQVVGEYAIVTTIVGPNSDAHVYQPSIADARSVAEADIIFVNGLGFETWSDTLIANSGTKGSLHVATDGIIPVLVDDEVDPHAWNSLLNGITYIENISAVLKQKIPEHEAEFTKNATAYTKQLRALDVKARTALAKLGPDKRTIVTSHDAFGYLADAYGMNFLAPLGIDSEAEPSAQELTKLIDQIKTDGVAALFAENITSPTLVKQIANETGLEIGGRLFSDALSDSSGPAASYLAMFEHNLKTLFGALN